MHYAVNAEYLPPCTQLLHIHQLEPEVLHPQLRLGCAAVRLTCQQVLEQKQVTAVRCSDLIMKQDNFYCGITVELICGRVSVCFVVRFFVDRRSETSRAQISRVPCSGHLRRTRAHAEAALHERPRGGSVGIVFELPGGRVAPQPRGGGVQLQGFGQDLRDTSGAV